MPKGVRIGGRQVGTPNKTTSTAKEIIARVAEELGGWQGMLAWVNDDPTGANKRTFYGHIFPKLLPVQVSGPNEGPIQFEGFKVELVKSTISKPE